MQKPPLIITNVLVFIVTGILAFVCAPLWVLYNGVDLSEILTAVFLFFFTGMSITAGYHRLWSHKSYEANPYVRIILAVGGAMALQNSILHWASDHRVHHRHVDDNDKDPYSAGKGLWFSHIGWMLREYQASSYSDYSNCKDLQRDPIVMWQHKFYLPIVLIANFGITGLLGWFNGDIVGMILVAGVLRLVLVHHVTFFINSLAHYWGKQPYTDKNTARDNGIIALFTFGEGYHNYHHIFEYDYRNGIRWWQYDPTKWLIKSLSLVGLTWNLRVCPEERIEKARIAQQLKQATSKIAAIPQAEELLSKVHNEYEVLISRMSRYYETRKKLLSTRKDKLVDSWEKLDLDFHYEEIKDAFELQKRKWTLLMEQFQHNNITSFAS